MNQDLQSVQQNSTIALADEIAASLVQARAILDLVQGSGENIQHGFNMDHQTIMNSLWCIAGLLEEVDAKTGRLCHKNVDILNKGLSQ